MSRKCDCFAHDRSECVCGAWDEEDKNMRTFIEWLTHECEINSEEVEQKLLEVLDKAKEML